MRKNIGPKVILYFSLVILIAATMNKIILEAYEKGEGDNAVMGFSIAFAVIALAIDLENSRKELERDRKGRD